MADILGLAHIGVFVKDLEVSKKFYCEKLGFEVVHETSVEENGGLTKVGFLKSGTCELELIQLAKPEKTVDGTVNHIAFKVKDIEKIAENLRKKGIVYETEEIVPLPTFFDKGVKFIMFRGPDNERLELCEIL